MKELYNGTVSRMGGPEVMEPEQMNKPLRDLIEIMHFTENVSAKIHGLMGEAEIYKTLREEFAKSKRYTMTVFLLTDDGSKLTIATTSQFPEKLKAAEKATGLKVKEYKVDFEKSTILSQAVREGKTLQVNFTDLVREFTPRSLAHLVIKIMGYEKRKSILTPLRRHGKIIGVFAMTSTELAEHFIPSVRNLAQHISTALELADEHVERKMMEKALEDQFLFLQHLIDTIPNPIFYKDTNGIFQGCNKAYEAFRGLPKEKILGKTVYDLDSEELADKYWQMDLELFRNSGVQVYEFAARHADGAKHDVIFNKATYTNADGAVAGLIGVMIDISERKRMEEELAHERDLLHTLMDNIPDAIFFKDVESRFMRINRAHAQRIGLSDANQAIGKTVFDFYPDEYAQEAYADDQRILKTGQPVIGKVESIRTKDGHVRWSSITKVPIADKTGRTTGIVGISRDTTERKRMGEDLKRYAEHLEEMVEERTRKLGEAERMGVIGETAAMVGHDLRNPLQVVVNALYSAGKMLEIAPPSVKEFAEEHGAEELLRRTGKQVEYMNKIVSDLQDYARSLRPELAETSLHQLINETVSTMKVPDAVKVSIYIEEDFPRLRVDPAMMKRVFTNLITNAFQAMPNGGQLTIRAHSTEEAVFISFQDTGVGIPEENLPKLFQPLFTTRPKGTGFGLPVCKRLIEAHDGNISVESKAGKGSTFTLKMQHRKGR